MHDRYLCYLHSICPSQPPKKCLTRHHRFRKSWKSYIDMSFETSESDGPDPYVVPGFSLHSELEWLVKSGFSPMQALQSATFNPAGVGAGTLYRHFATRDELTEAVYRSEVEKLAAAEGRFAETLSPVEALRVRMLLFVDYIAAKQIIAPALNSVAGDPSKLYEGSRGLIQGAIDALVKRAIKSGDIRRDLDPFDLLRALIGVSHVASGPGWQQSARRLVDILYHRLTPGHATGMIGGANDQERQERM